MSMASPSHATRVELARARVGCPSDTDRGCGAVAGSTCVYLGPPEWMASRPSLRPMVERAGKPMATVHAARLRAYHVWETARRARQRASRPMPPPTTRARIAGAEREFDQRERVELVEWLRAGGGLLLLSVVELPQLATFTGSMRDGGANVLDGPECPECDAPVELLMSGVRCTSCAWWFCR